MQEGSLQSEQLIGEIERGLRRPRGNLVPQLLCFQAHLPQACRLSSLRISRIAVQPDWQQQGIEQQLVKNICQDAQVDFCPPVLVTPLSWLHFGKSAVFIGAFR